MKERNYAFDGAISEEVLRNYLSRSIVLSYLGGWRYKDETPEKTAEDCRNLILRTGAKYIARAACAWIPGPEEAEKLPLYQEELQRVHSQDPTVIFEACIFETAYRRFEQLAIPPEVFRAFGLPPEERCFRYEDMLFPDGTYVDHWEPGGSVPDITRLETQLFFYWRGCLYIDLGFEALHYGQVLLIGEQDQQYACWTKVLNMVREYAKRRARRHFVLLNAHTHGIIGTDGKLLFDFHCYPCRPVADESVQPHPPAKGNPQPARLISGWGNSIYQRSLGGETHSGWSCASLPYFVEIDNYGCQPPELLNQPVDYYPWGYDEISWFANQHKDYRREWVLYARDWLREKDPAGYLEMTGIRPFRRYAPELPERLTRGEFYYVNAEEFSDEDILTAVWSEE